MALLEREPAVARPAVAEPAPDRAPDELAAGVAQPLRGELEALLGADRVLARAGDIVRYASDASPYRLLPAGGGDGARRRRRRQGPRLRPRSGHPGHLPRRRHQPQRPGPERRHPRRRAPPLRRRRGRGRTARCARVKPGTVLGHANRVLAPHGRKLGPDPASTDIATRRRRRSPTTPAGCAAASTKDSYSTVRSLTFVLPSGTTIDTAAPGAAERFAAAEPELAAGLAAIRDEIRADAELSERIRRKFAIKNTTGYRLCAFLDADEPLEIFRRLARRLRGHARLRRRGRLRDGAAAGARRPPPGSTSPASTRRSPRSATWSTAGATAVELMVAPALITAAWNMVGAPRGVERAAARVGGAAGRVRRRRPSAELDAQVAEAERDPRRPRDDPPDRLHPRAGGDRARLAGARGPARADRPAAPAGHGADRRGRLRAAGADRRGRPRPAGAARRARLPARRRRPRLRREPPLHAHPGLRQAGGPRALRGLHGEPGRADRRQVRRLAQGRARDRDQHGPLCGARVGGEGDRADVAGEAARRPRRRALPRRRPQPRPRRPPAQPENDAADRGVGDDLRRVRLLRAGLPEPQPDDDAAPADRPAPRDGPPAGGLAGAARRCCEEYEYDGARHLRRRRLLPARLPGRDRHRQAGQGTARASATPSGPKRRRWRRRSAGRAVEGASRAGPAARRPAGAPDASAARRLPGPRAAPRPKRDAAATSPSCTDRRRRPSTCPSCTNRIFGPASTRSRGAGRRSRRGPGCRSGSRTTSPAAAAGCPGARKASARRTATRRTRWSSGSGAGAGRGRCRSSSTPPPAPARSPNPARACSTRRTPSASPSSRSSTRSPGPTTACCPSSRSAARSAPPPSTRPAPPATWASPRACAPSPAPSPRTSTSPPRRPAAASPATAASPTPS